MLASTYVQAYSFTFISFIHPPSSASSVVFPFTATSLLLWQKAQGEEQQIDKTHPQGYARGVNLEQRPPERCEPRGNEAHVWILETGRALRHLEFLRGLLSPEERARAAAFVREELARRFIVNRGALRLLLGRYLGRPPESLSFSYDPYGKPRLDPVRPRLDFNLSHADDLALFAFSAGKRVGVDVETVREQRDVAGMAEYVFPAATAASLAALDAEERLVRFYRLWTRLESVAKATGRGLGILAAFKEADLEAAAPFSLVCAGSSWRVTDLDIGPACPAPGDHLAAACLEGEDCRARLFSAAEAFRGTRQEG
jgi:4'-phosphopantetheinyl transferase